MWLAYLPVLGIIAGIALAIVGAAPIGIPLAVIAAGVLSFTVRQNSRPSREPKTVPGGHKETGYAHPGQEHMVPRDQV